MAGARVSSLCFARPGYLGTELCRARRQVPGARETRQKRENLWGAIWILIMDPLFRRLAQAYLFLPRKDYDEGGKADGTLCARLLGRIIERNRGGNFLIVLTSVISIGQESVEGSKKLISGSAKRRRQRRLRLCGCPVVACCIEGLKNIRFSKLNSS